MMGTRGSFIRDLLRRTDRAGHQSVHADRLRQRLHAARGYGDLQQELLEEMAHALGRAGDKVDAALLECELLAPAAERGDDPEALEAYEAKRREAIAALRDLTIHREALGLYRHDELERTYRIPPPLRPTRAPPGR